MSKHLLLFPVFLAATLVATILYLAGVTHAAAEYAQSISTAHVAIQYAPGDLTIQPITFTDPITGLLALEKTGLPIVTYNSPYGIAVCSINGLGCPANDCFCSSKYWGYNYWDGNVWQGYSVGASESIVVQGGVEGWVYGEYLGPGLPAATQLLAASTALEWLRPQQDPVTGGFGNNSNSSEMLLTVGANHEIAASWQVNSGNPSLQQYWFLNAPSFTRSRVENGAKLAVGLAATASCWPANTRKPAEFYNITTGSFSPYSGFQAWAMLGMSALDQPMPALARLYLISLAQSNGGWEWNTGFGTDTNTTALAIQALISAGEPLTSTAITQGLAYIKSLQNTDGGFPYNPVPGFPCPSCKDSDTNSTAYVIQAIYAVGQNPITGTWVISGTNPIIYLLNMQLPDGSFEWQKGSGADVLSTQQAIPALLGESMPFQVADLPDCPSLFYPTVTIR